AGCGGHYIGDNTWRIVMTVPTTQDPFDWGEVGIRSPTTVLVALLALPGTNTKAADETTELHADLVLTSTVATQTVLTPAVDRARPVEWYDVRLMVQPSAAESNWYHTHSYTENATLPTQAVYKDASTWDLPSHPFPIAAGVAVTAGSTTSAVNVGTDLTTVLGT